MNVLEKFYRNGKNKLAVLLTKVVNAGHYLLIRPDNPEINSITTGAIIGEHVSGDTSVKINENNYAKNNSINKSVQVNGNINIVSSSISNSSQGGNNIIGTSDTTEFGKVIQPMIKKLSNTERAELMIIICRFVDEHEKQSQSKD